MSLSFKEQGRDAFPIGQTLFPLLVSLLGTIIAVFPGNPGNMTLPSRDSGVFLYMGWRLLEGDTPYRDVWDHKPPLIYIVDALGLSLTPGSLWGVWLLQFFFIFVTLLLLYKLLGREFGIFAALAGTITLTSGLLTILDRGNVTEGYALVFQALCFWLFVRAWKRDFPLRTMFWIGLAGGLAFNLKQTTIGVWVTCGLLLLAMRVLQRRAPVRELLSLLAGWLLPSLVFILYFASQHALADFWEQAYLYNFVYIGKHDGIRRLIPVFLKGFAYLQKGGVLYLAVLGWLVGLIYAWTRRKSPGEVHPLILVALIDLPIEVFLITISGRSILHYYLTPLPVMAILAGLLVALLPRLLGNLASFSSQKRRRWLPGVVMLVVLVAQYGQFKYYPEVVHSLAENDYAPVIDYVAGNTESNDKVLLIGAESAVNFLTRRQAPTRYVYQYPLALLGRRPMFEEYFNDILSDKPVLIIDTRGRERLDEKLYTPLQKRSQIVRDGVKYLGEHYRQVAQFGDWFVYRLMDESMPSGEGAG